MEVEADTVPVRELVCENELVRVEDMVTLQVVVAVTVSEDVKDRVRDTVGVAEGPGDALVSRSVLGGLRTLAVSPLPS